jgi:hypothetical protein
MCGGADAVAHGTHALRAGALPLLEAALKEAQAVVDEDEDEEGEDWMFECIDNLERVVLMLQRVRADAAMAELLAEEDAEAALKPKGGKGAKTKAKASKAKAAGAAKAGAAKTGQSPPAKAAAAAQSAAASTVAEAPPPVPPPAPLAPVPPPQPPLPPWLLQAMQRPPPPPAPAAPPVAQPAAVRGAWAQRPPSLAGASAATHISPPAPVPAAASALQRLSLAEAATPLPRWEVAPSPPPRAPAGAWGRARPAIPGLGAGELPRELECAICLDAAVEGRTPCCGQAAFCAPCAAALSGECPLCRAMPRDAATNRRDART